MVDLNSDVLEIVISAKDKFSSAFQKLRKESYGIPKIFAAASAAISGYGAATFAAAKTTAEAYDKVGKFSERIGISTEALSAYNHIAELSGISNETLSMGFQRMTRRIAEAGQGTGVAVAALKQLQIPIKEIESLSPDKQFEKIAASMDRVKNQSDKVRLAMQFFDSEGVALLQTLAGGSKGLEAMKAEAEKFGLVISQDAAKNAAAFNDSLTRLTGAFTGLKNYFAEQVMPTFTGGFNELANYIADNRDKIIEFAGIMSQKLTDAGKVTLYVVAGMVDAWRGLKMTYRILQIAFNEFLAVFSKGADWLIEKTLSLMKAVNFRGIFDDAIIKAEEFRNVTSNLIMHFEEESDIAHDALLNIVDEGSMTNKVGKVVDVIETAYERIKEAGKNAAESNTQNNELFLDEISMQLEGWDLINQKIQDYIENIPTWAETVGELITETFDMVSQGIGDAVADNLINQKNLAESFKQLMRTVAANIISTLIQVGIQRLIISKLFVASAVTENIQRMGSLTQQTYSGAFAATAAIPIVGPALAPGVATASTATMLSGAAASKGLGMAAGALAEGGTAYSGLPYIIGERGPELFVPGKTGQVVPNEDLGGIGGGVVIEQLNISILPNATNAEALLYMRQSDWNEVIEDKILTGIKQLRLKGITA